MAKSEKKAEGWRRNRSYRRNIAHVPGPRRKRKFPSQEQVPVVPTEEETVAEAPAEAEVSDEGRKPSKRKKKVTKKKAAKKSSES